MKVEDLITQKTLNSYIEERRTTYNEKAARFLRQEFAPATRRLNDADIIKVVRLSYDNARRRGITSERDLLKYLIPTMYWGSWFECDPQYADILIRIGWKNSDGTQRFSRNMDPIIEEIDIWQAATVSDSLEPRRAISAALSAHKEPFINPNIPNAIALMKNAWPARTCLLSSSRQDLFAASCLEYGYKHGLRNADLLCHVILAQYFGWRFPEDPRYPWAISAFFTKTQDPAHQRLALEDGILNYWSGLLGVPECL